MGRRASEVFSVLRLVGNPPAESTSIEQKSQWPQAKVRFRVGGCCLCFLRFCLCGMKPSQAEFKKVDHLFRVDPPSNFNREDDQLKRITANAITSNDGIVSSWLRFRIAS